MTLRDKKVLIQEIEDAWAAVAYPGDTNIITPMSYDDEGITRYFSGTTWKGHATCDLRVHASAISVFFTPAAYQYWLPAYLIAAVNEPEELSQGIDSILFSIDPATTKGAGTCDERLTVLTSTQRRTLLHVLEFVLGDDCFDDDKIVLEYLRAASDTAG